MTRLVVIRVRMTKLKELKWEILQVKILSIHPSFRLCVLLLLKFCIVNGGVCIFCTVKILSIILASAELFQQDGTQAMKLWISIHSRLGIIIIAIVTPIIIVIIITIAIYSVTIEASQCNPLKKSVESMASLFLSLCATWFLLYHFKSTISSISPIIIPPKHPY